MQPDAVVEYFNVFKYRQTGIRSALKTGTINQLSFQGSENRLDTGVVVTIAFSAHTKRDAKSLRACW